MFLFKSSKPWWWLSVFIVLLPGTTISLQGHGNGKDDDVCPCMHMDKCPRIYGQSAVDVRELGFLEPCRQFGTVRCCGVTVSFGSFI